MEDIKKFFDYMFFRDMGEIGEGCLMSIIVWIFISVFIMCLVSMIGKYFSLF